MTKEQIIEKVKTEYEIILVDFRVYDTSNELFEKEKDNLSVYANETLGENLGEEDNVFKINKKWIYSPEWYDAEWDD